MAANKTLRVLSGHVDLTSPETEVGQVKAAAKDILHDFPDYDVVRLRLDMEQARICIQNCAQVIKQLRNFDPLAYEDPRALKAKELGISEAMIRVKLAERVSTALNNISTANVRAVRRAVLDDAWSARHDAPPEGFKLPFDKRRKE